MRAVEIDARAVEFVLADAVFGAVAVLVTACAFDAWRAVASIASLSMCLNGTAREVLALAVEWTTVVKMWWRLALLLLKDLFTLEVGAELIFTMNTVTFTIAMRVILRGLLIAMLKLVERRARITLLKWAELGAFVSLLQRAERWTFPGESEWRSSVLCVTERRKAASRRRY